MAVHNSSLKPDPKISLEKTPTLLAKHRKCQTLDTADVKLCLSQQWDLQIPGFPVEDTKHKKQQTGEAHKQRLALIRKQLKR